MPEFIDESTQLESTTIGIFRTAATVKGGRRFSFSALVVAGDRRGNIGWGYGKANEVPPAIEKAQKEARRALKKVPLHGGTIPHEVTGRFSATKVKIMPASPGTGVVAGAPVRAVMEMLGVTDCITKCFGSTNKINVVKAALDGLARLSDRETVAARRDIQIDSTVVDEMLERGKAYLPAESSGEKMQAPVNTIGQDRQRGRGRGGRRAAAAAEADAAAEAADATRAARPSRSSSRGAPPPPRPPRTPAPSPAPTPAARTSQTAKPRRQPVPPGPTAMMIHDITAIAGKHKARKRIGRGRGSGVGKTSGRGHNGAGSRAGYSRKPAFEGGQMPYFRRMPKRGFNNANYATRFRIVNLRDIVAHPDFASGGDVTAEALTRAGLIQDNDQPLKVLGDLGDAASLSAKLSVTAERVTASARKHVEGAGGSVDETGTRRDKVRGVDRNSRDHAPTNLTKKLSAYKRRVAPKG